MDQIVEQLYHALIGVAERQLPGDPLPCFCVRHELDDRPGSQQAVGDPHDEWCENARHALKAAQAVGVSAQPA